MGKVIYTGLSDATAAFEALRPYHKALIEMRTGCRPFGPEYHVLSAAQDALVTAAFHFTRDPPFFSDKPHG